MKVTPQNGGALLVEDLSPETVYDMGNARLYAQCDAQGRIVSATLAEGSPLHMMEAVRYSVLDANLVANATSIAEAAENLASQFKGTQSEGTGKTIKRMWEVDPAHVLSFEWASAIGRSWTLMGRHRDLAVIL